MASNEDRVDAILDQMWKENEPQALSEGLNILSKLTAKYHLSYAASSAIRLSRSTEESRLPTTPSRIRS
jgi:protein involved in temperature-dependent protein secretion